MCHRQLQRVLRASSSREEEEEEEVEGATAELSTEQLGVRFIWVLGVNITHEPKKQMVELGIWWN